MATIDDFHEIEMRVGTVLSAEDIEGSEKLLRLEVDFNEEKPRQVLSGIKNFVNKEDLVGKQFPFVTNLPPRDMMGLTSEAMILGAGDSEVFTLFNPTNEVPNGTKLK